MRKHQKNIFGAKKGSFQFFVFHIMLCQIEPGHSKSPNIFAIRPFFSIFLKDFFKTDSICSFRDFRLVEFIQFNRWKWSIRPPEIRICKKISNRSIFFYFFLIFKDFKANKTELPMLKKKKHLKMQIKNN